MTQAAQTRGGRGSRLAFSRTGFQLLAACCLGVLLGLASVAFSPLLVLAAVAGIAFGLAVLKRPEIGLLGVLLVTSTVVDGELLPLVPIGVGSLHISDVLLLGLFAVILARKLVERDFKMLDSPLSLPLIAFYGVAVLSTVLAVLGGSVPAVDALREMRVVTYYLTFFVVIGLVREARQLNLLLTGMLALASLVAVAMVAQAALGDATRLVPGRVASLQTADVTYAGITRILPPGQSLVQVGLVVTVSLLAMRSFKASSLLRLLQAGLLGAAVVLTFNRNFWVGAGLALLLLAMLAGPYARRRMAGWMALAIFLGSVALIPTVEDPGSPPARIAAATTERAGTLFRGETLGESSLQMRYIENEYAVPQIVSNPVLGLGLGADYRPLVPQLDYGGEDRRNYVHNGHFWVMLKTGLLGYLALVWLSAAFLFRSLRQWRSVTDPRFRAVVLGFALTYVGVLASNIVDPIFAQRFWVPVLGIMMGVNEVILAGPARNAAGSSQRQQE